MFSHSFMVVRYMFILETVYSPNDKCATSFDAYPAFNSLHSRGDSQSSQRSVLQFQWRARGDSSCLFRHLQLMRVQLVRKLAL